MFVIKLNHQTHGTTNYFTLSNKYKNQHWELKEANELCNQIDELEEESGYTLDSITKLTIKVFRYNDIKGSSYCKLSQPFWSSKSIVNTQNDQNDG